MDSRSNGRASLKQLRSETRVTMKETRRILGRPPKTIRRWAHEGLLIVGTQERVTLEYYYDGKELITTVEAYDRILERINGAR